MQFEFLKTLFALRASASSPPTAASPSTLPSPSAPPAPSTPPPPVPTSEVSLPSSDSLLREARILLQAAGAPGLAEMIKIQWNGRLKNTAGLAYPSRNVVKLNPRLIEFGLEEVDRTLRHELAHLLAHHRVGRRRIQPHGPEWKKACRDLGLFDEKRTHDLPLPRHRRKPRYFYGCPACGFLLPRVQPLRRASACIECCRKHNRGRFDPRFRFVRIPTKSSDGEA